MSTNLPSSQAATSVHVASGSGVAHMGSAPVGVVSSGPQVLQETIKTHLTKHQCKTLERDLSLWEDRLFEIYHEQNLGQKRSLVIQLKKELDELSPPPKVKGSTKTLIGVLTSAVLILTGTLVQDHRQAEAQQAQLQEQQAQVHASICLAADDNVKAGLKRNLDSEALARVNSPDIDKQCGDEAWIMKHMK